MDGKIQVTPGYYGLAMCAVYSSLDDVPEIHQKFLRSAQPNSFVLTPAPEFEGDIFYVSQVISSGGVVVSMASHHLRSDDPTTALANVAEIVAESACPINPVSVLWLETFTSLDYH